MMVRIVSEDEYFASFPTPHNVFCSRGFCDVVRQNAQAVRYIVGDDPALSPKLGIIVGYRDGVWYAPYSAPFSAIAYNKAQQVETVYDFISELTDFLGAELRITLPPSFYDPLMLPKISGTLTNYAKKTIADFNSYFPLDRLPDYMHGLDHAARKNMRRAQSVGFIFAPTTDIARAYSVIEANRKSHGYPLAMSLEQVQRTAEVVPVDFFVMSLDAQDVAAAMVYHVSPGIVQVIYWGDAPGFSELRPMNIFPFLLFSHYQEQDNIKIVDIGPSSTHGIPNSGLLRFKESIGCLTTIRPTFVF